MSFWITIRKFFVCVFLKDSSESEGFGLKIPVVRTLH